MMRRALPAGSSATACTDATDHAPSDPLAQANRAAATRDCRDEGCAPGAATSSPDDGRRTRCVLPRSEEDQAACCQALSAQGPKAPTAQQVTPVRRIAERSLLRGIFRYGDIDLYL